MAKVGEGDARWIVNDLGDSGRNVNGAQLLRAGRS
jgi:hypothetical protein